jgi:predicted dehydrogenase
MKTKVAVIGVRNQAARHINLLKKRVEVQLHAVFHPAGKTGDRVLPLTENFSDVLESDAVIIASPTNTHAHYLNLLKNYPGYILLEKPAVSSSEESQVLEQWSNDKKFRTRVNFNLCFSKLRSVLSEILASQHLGDLISFDVHTSQGLAFTQRYQESWRSQQGSSFGVLETVGVHYFHLLLLLFGEMDKVDVNLLHRAGHFSGPPDTGMVRIQMHDGMLATLRHSYAAPACNRLFLIGTNGFWEYDGKVARLYSPRESFDQEGRFTTPPLVREDKIDHSIAWQESLDSAQEDFLAVASKQGQFDLAEFHRSLKAMEWIFKYQEGSLADE